MRENYIHLHWLPRALAAFTLLLAGCTAPIESDLSESQANEIIVALHSGGIAGEKRPVEGSAGDFRFEVRVPRADEALALSVLAAAELPRRSAPGVAEIFGEGGLVPSATEERARYLTAVAGELSRTLESIDGVLAARVHVATAEVGTLSLDSAPPAARASVFIKYRADLPPPEEAHIRALVAGAVTNLEAEEISVVILPNAPAAAGPERLERLGPLTLTANSAATLRHGMAFILVVLIALAAALMVAIKRGRRRTFRRPVAG